MYTKMGAAAEILPEWQDTITYLWLLETSTFKVTSGSSWWFALSMVCSTATGNAAKPYSKSDI